MRSFPGVAWPRTAAAGMTLLVGLGAMTLPTAAPGPAITPVAAAASLATADDDLSDQQDQVEDEIDEATTDLHASSQQARRAYRALAAAKADLAAAQGVLTTARAKVTAAAVVDARMRQRLATARARLAEARDDLAAGREAMEEQSEQVRASVVELYQQGDPQLDAISSFLDARTPGDIALSQRVNEVVVEKQEKAYDRLRAAEVLLEVRKDDVAEATAAVAERRREAADHLDETRQVRAAAREAREVVATQVATRREAKQAADEAKAADEAVLARLQRREERIKQRILAASRRASGGYRGSTDGLLVPPVDAPVTSSYGYRIHPIYGYWGLHNGTDFGAACGTPLRAVAGGTVMSTWYSTSYGNRLYLDLGQVNGKNLTVVYNHLSEYAVSTGQRVAQGQTVGYVGDTGWSTGCHLHFTVLVDGSPVDPMNWL